MISQILAVSAGGALGAVMRFLNHKIISHYFANNVYWSTLVVNVTGCFLMGIAYVWFQNKIQPTSHLHLFVTVGFLGALTTWSTFSMESMLLINQGLYIKAAVYTGLTFILCFGAFAIGTKIG